MIVGKPNYVLLQSIVDTLGVQGTIALADHAARRTIYIPTAMPRYHPLVRALGHSAALKLCIQFGGQRLTVPTANSLRAPHYRAMGLTHAEIASKIGMTASGVQAMLARQRKKAGVTADARPAS